MFFSAPLEHHRDAYLFVPYTNQRYSQYVRRHIFKFADSAVNVTLLSSDDLILALLLGLVQVFLIQH